MQRRTYRGTITARGLANALKDPVMPDGDHTWCTADRFIALTLPLYDRALRYESSKAPDHVERPR